MVLLWFYYGFTMVFLAFTAPFSWRPGQPGGCARRPDRQAQRQFHGQAAAHGETQQHLVLSLDGETRFSRYVCIYIIGYNQCIQWKMYHI